MVGAKHPLTFRHYFWAIVRVFMGLIFLWAFLDKLIGLGFATCRDSASNVVSYMCYSSWVNGGSPTFGFLTHGIMIRLGSLTGSLMLLLMWTALFPPANHPFIDDHIIYSFVMLGFAFVHTCKHLGLGKWWTSLKFVKNRWLLH